MAPEPRPSFQPNEPEWSQLRQDAVINLTNILKTAEAKLGPHSDAQDRFYEIAQARTAIDIVEIMMPANAAHDTRTRRNDETRTLEAQLLIFLLPF
jgi:hypothetical protein